MDATSKDEIDLQELAIRIIRYFLSHFIFILVSCGVGVALGVFTFRASPNKYESQMVILSDLLTKTYGDQASRSLNKLVNEENFDELAAKLGLPGEKVNSISSIEIESITEIKAIEREKVDKDETFFIVTVSLTDRGAFADVQNGILHFFKNNEFVKIRARQREQFGEAVIKKIDKELKSIDSMKMLLMQSQPFKGERLMFDPEKLFTTSVELTEKRWENSQNVELANSIHLLEGFTVFQKPKDPKLSIMVLAGFLVGFIGALILLTLKHLFKLALSR